MVHTPYARRETGVAERSYQLHARGSEEPERTDRYVLIPDALILAFAHDPLAVGVYTAIARFARAAKDAVPLAARDLTAWIGSERDAERAAIMRRIRKLEEHGWLMITRTRASKHHLLPTWGRAREGTIRPWRYEQSDSGRPASVRGRRVPLGLLDTYVGRLDPNPGQGHALVSRYFSRPLLDLTDIGVYAIGLRAEVAPTPRLRHLGLYGVAGVTTPADEQSLMELAAAGHLSTLVADVVVRVQLSVQGQGRLGIASTIAVTSHVELPESQCGSLCRSDAGSTGRSLDGDRALMDIAQEEAQNSSGDPATSLIAWDVGKDHERINHDRSPNVTCSNGGGHANVRGSSSITRNTQCGHQGANCNQQRCLNDRVECPPVALTASLIHGHSDLNPDRPLLAGEWLELLALQETYGADQLLIWQARARRVRCERPNGITPAYYQACAARAAVETYRPRRSVHVQEAGANSGITPPALPTPACNDLLVSMGIRERQKLGAVPYALIAAWQTALAHPGMAAQFSSPIGFVVAQMQRGNSPPSTAELDRWAEHQRRQSDRYESWRFIDPVLGAGASPADEQELEARVRAVAPVNADIADLCALACALEAGASDAEALAQLASLNHEAAFCARSEK